MNKDSEELATLESMRRLLKLANANTVKCARAFVAGFLAPTPKADPLGQSLAQGLLGQLLRLNDEEVETLIMRGHEVLRERQAG